MRERKALREVGWTLGNAFGGRASVPHELSEAFRAQCARPYKPTNCNLAEY